MRPAHYLAIAVSLGVIACLYFGGRTTPPVKPGAVPVATGGMVHAHISIDSLREASRAQLPVHARDSIAAIERELEAVTDSVLMAPLMSRLAQIWQEHRELPLAAWYHAEAAKLENSEKKLNFAGQFFLQLMQHAGSHDMQAWEAEQAIDCFQRALRINPDNDTIRLALAAGYIEGTGETMEGVQVLLGITRKDPDHIPANLMLGRLALQSGQLDKAVERYETVLRQEPANTEALYFLAETYKGKGDKEKAIALFEECKKIVNKPEFTRDIDQYINSFK